MSSGTVPDLPEIVRRGDHDYDHARRAWNLAADLHPAAAAIPVSAAETALAVQYAREQGLRIAPIGSGHLATAIGDLSDALLVRPAIEPSIIVDTEHQVVRVGAGAEWGAVVRAVAPEGLAVLAGTASDVGVVGYLLGGGVSWFGRKYGLAVNHVVSFEVVLADGRVVETSADEEPELFWALCGGLGNFGVVTSVVLRLLPIAEVYAGATLWDAAAAEAILKRWAAWTAVAPESVTTSGRLLQLPDLPDIPEPIRGRGVVAIDGCALGDSTPLEALLEELRAIATPMMDRWGTMAPDELLTVHMDPPQPVPGHSDHTMLGPLDDAAIDALVGAAGPGSGSPLLVVELRHCGGALARAGEGCARLDGEFALFGVGIPTDPAVEDAIGAQLDVLRDAMQPWATGSAYLPFDERGGHTAELGFPPEVYARLRTIRATYDPDGVLLASHPVELT